MAVLMLLSVQSWAAPAPWYQWRSKLDGELICRQVSPGPGWEKAIGPFQDPHCKHLVRR